MDVEAEHEWEKIAAQLIARILPEIMRHHVEKSHRPDMPVITDAPAP